LQKEKVPIPKQPPKKNFVTTFQPSEPILFPKLRIYFADFPYPHCSNATRGWSPWRPDAVISTTWQKKWGNFKKKKLNKNFAKYFFKKLEKPHPPSRKNSQCMGREGKKFNLFHAPHSHGFSRAVQRAPDRSKRTDLLYQASQPSLQIIWFHGRTEKQEKQKKFLSPPLFLLVNKKRQLFQGHRPTILSPRSLCVAACTKRKLDKLVCCPKTKKNNLPQVQEF